MAFDPCAPCTSINCVGNVTPDLYRNWVIRLLCSILAAVGGGAAAAVVFLDSIVGAAASTLLTASWTAQSFLDAEGKLRGGYLVNNTDVVILGSFDAGTTTAFSVEPGQIYAFPYGQNGVAATGTDLSLKSGSAGNGTIGTYDVNGFY